MTADGLKQMLADVMKIAEPGKYDQVAWDTANQLRASCLSIAKQLLEARLKSSALDGPGKISTADLQTMIADYESYWADQSGRSDIETEKANMLPNRIVEVATELLQLL